MPGHSWSRRRWNEHILTGNKAAAWGVPSRGGCRATAAGSERDTPADHHRALPMEVWIDAAEGKVIGGVTPD